MVIEIDKEALVNIVAANYIDYNTYLRQEDKEKFSSWLKDSKVIAKENFEGELSEKELINLYTTLENQGILKSYEDGTMSLEDYVRLMLEFTPTSYPLCVEGFKIIKE